MTLPPRRRATVVLRYYCDYSIEQAAQALGCSTGTVKSQTAKALAQLRGVLDPSGPADGGTPTPGPGVSEPGFRVRPSVSGRTL